MHPRQPIVPQLTTFADPAEVRALRLLVSMLLAAEAERFAQAGGGPPEKLFGHMSAICQEAVLASGAPDEITTATLDHVNSILGTVAVSRRPQTTN